MGKAIWVIGWDYGSEGKSEPEIAFKTKAEAEGAIALIERNPSATRCYLTETVIWDPQRELNDD